MDNDMPDSIAFATSCVPFSQMEFRESFRFLNSLVSSESGRLDSEAADDSDRFAGSSNIGFSVHIASQRVFADSEAVRGSGLEYRSLWLNLVGFAMSRSFCESQAQGSREFLSHLNYSHFGRDSVDLARSAEIVDQSCSQSATGVGTRSARFGGSLAAASLGLEFYSQAIRGTVTEIPSLLLSSLIDSSIAEVVGADAGQAIGVKTVWISLATIFAVLLVVGTIVLVVLVVHRRRASMAPADETETDGAIPVDDDGSLDDVGNFLSEENALSHDRGFSNPRLKIDIHESFNAKMAEHPNIPQNDCPE
jgi:hypothetical protein